LSRLSTTTATVSTVTRVRRLLGRRPVLFGALACAAAAADITTRSCSLASCRWGGSQRGAATAVAAAGTRYHTGLHGFAVFAVAVDA
jgi:hypothetical protein